MASTVIHMAVASEINKVIKRDYNKLIIGAIAPDITKCLGDTKLYSHFLDEVGNNVPNMERFLDKYKSNLNDDFVLGYYIHLYTDYLWFKYFVPEFYNDNYVTKLDGTVIKCTERMIDMYIYNDYTNLNDQLIKDYKIDLKPFYVRYEQFEDIITEIPIDKIDILMDKTLEIIEESKVSKDMVFDITNIKKFIKTATELTITNLKEVLE